MSSRKGLLWVVLLTGFAPSCGADDPGALDGFTHEEWGKIRTLSPLPPVPPDPTNMYSDNPAAATLGQRFFFEKSYAGAITVIADAASGGLGNLGETGKFSCAACHNPTGSFCDNRSVPNSISFAANYHIRNTPSLFNLPYYKWYNWDGRWDTQWARGDVEAKPSMASDRLRVAHVVWNKYRADYDALFPVALDPALSPTAPDAARFPPSGKPKANPTDPDGPWEMMAPDDQATVNLILVNFLKAIDAYTRRIVSGNSPFDRYVAGDRKAIDPGAKRGLKLFIGKANCIECHNGPVFSDNQFHNLGVPQSGTHVPAVDVGRFAAVPPLLASSLSSDGMYSDDKNTGRLAGLAQSDQDRGRFRTAQLRNIAITGPYMHTGQYRTLSDVVWFYNWGGDYSGFAGTKDTTMRPLYMGADEVADVVLFLNTLTGQPVPMELTMDTSAP